MEPPADLVNLENNAKKKVGRYWKELQLGPTGFNNIFDKYESTREARLNAETITEEDYNGLKNDDRSCLTSPEIKIYDQLVRKLEELTPNPKWKGNGQANDASKGA